MLALQLPQQQLLLILALLIQHLLLLFGQSLSIVQAACEETRLTILQVARDEAIQVVSRSENSYGVGLEESVTFCLTVFIAFSRRQALPSTASIRRNAVTKTCLLLVVGHYSLGHSKRAILGRVTRRNAAASHV